jgi:hypothetical protein
MDAKEQEALSEAANSLQVATLLVSRVRRTAADQADDSVQLQAAIDRAARALRRLLPKSE